MCKMYLITIVGNPNLIKINNLFLIISWIILTEISSNLINLAGA